MAEIEVLLLAVAQNGNALRFDLQNGGLRAYMKSLFLARPRGTTQFANPP